MRVAKIRIGGRMFILSQEQDLDVLRRDIVAAATSGAGFVHFTSATNVAVSALVTPYLPVRISEIETASETGTSTDQLPHIIEDPPFAAGTQFDG
jgi:hypothetical protein